MKKVKGEDDLRPLYFFFGIVIFLWILAILLLKDTDNRGTFGDMFGSVNALYSGLALAGIIFTILLQKKRVETSEK